MILTMMALRKKTAWISGDDGFIVRDIDGDGQIDRGAELFGDTTTKKMERLQQEDLKHWLVMMIMLIQ